MAVLHHAMLEPSKHEMLQAWVADRPWGRDAGPVTLAGAYRFDDPAGEVGLETFLLTGADGVLLQVPLTYRAAPLPGAESSLLAVAQHSVLGSRWVYDGAADEVYARALLATMVDGGTQADIAFSTETGLVPWETTTFVRGRPGSTDAPAPSPPAAARISCDGVDVVLLRRLHVGQDAAPAGAPTLWGRWPGQETEVLLAWASAAAA